MLLHPGQAHGRQEVPPGAEDAGHQPGLQHAGDLEVDHIVVARIEARPAFFPRQPALVAILRVERGDAGIDIARRPGDHLRYRETFVHPVLHQPAGAHGPVEPPRERIPPRVGQPEEGRAIGKLERAPGCGHVQATVGEERMAARIGSQFDFAFPAMQAGVIRMAAGCPVSMPPGSAEA